ncbi:PHD finger protein At1g33420-like isoform X1 [Typha latifolia]|uniref:PHD finger protein At1g33420-like isoform X1 n=1 Tax=Typha latifolia TaxID=4733 RepID=UPI003C30BD61
MVVNGRPLKRAKRRVTADLCDFLSFPAGGEEGIGAGGGFDGPFRSNVREFLSRHARLLPPPLILSPPAAAAPPHIMIWRLTFRVGEAESEEAGTAVELNVVEEDVPRSKSIYCDQCRVVGWSGHPVCGKRYHFIIQNDANPLSGCRQTCCIRCGTLLPPSESRCALCKYEMTGDELEDWAYLQLEDSSHLLHAVVHANGYGHLLRVNGREGGSKYLTGRDIMGFWDRLCILLCVRKVTVMDISKKYGMEYRLLHAVRTGHPWYGEWGYKFGAGSYALTADSYQEAVDTVSNVPLSIFSQRRTPRTQLQDKISLYWSLSDRQLANVRDLFRYVTLLIHESHHHHLAKSAKEQPKDATSAILCAWRKEDVDHAEVAMVKVLRAVGISRWVSWRALRGATSMAIQSPELLDYCLKGLGGKSTDDGLVVAVRCNAETSAVEFRLEAASSHSAATRGLLGPSANHLLRDLKFFYDALLNPSTMQSFKPQTTRARCHSAAVKLLDCKQFIKHYDGPTSALLPLNPFVLHVWCEVELLDHPKDYTAPPPELLVLPMSATIADLKLQATKAFQETYLIFQTFQAEQLLGCEDANDSTPVKAVFSSNSNGIVVRIRGRCVGDHRRLGQFRMERGLENWTVDCSCGAKDDDGERMLACDSCGVWQHTRCAGIRDQEEVPAKFICRKCVGLCKPKGRGGGRSQTSSGGRCKDEIGSTINVAGRFGRLTTVG